MKQTPILKGNQKNNLAFLQFKSHTLRMQKKRYASKIIEESLLQFPAVLVLGARQVGKTTLCSSIAKEWLKFDLESQIDRGRVERDPEFFLAQNENKIFIDEAQISKDLFPALRIAIDRNRGEKGRFLLTGSSSPELLKNSSESLAGRIGIIELDTMKATEVNGHPLSCLYDFIKNLKDTKILLQEKVKLTNAELENFFLNGGYPEVTLLSTQEQKQRWFQSYIASYVERDLRNLFPGLNIQSFKLFFSMLGQLQGKLINMSDIARSLGVSQPTIREYLEIAHGTFFWRRINSYTKNSVRRVVKMPKGLFRDSGLVNYLMFLFATEQLRSSPVVGWLWEAMIIEEILKGCKLSSIIVEPYFYRTNDGREIDLILEGSFGLLPIEIKYGLNIRDQELKPLRTFIKENKLDLGLVISNTDTVKFIDEKIIEIPATFV